MQDSTNNYIPANERRDLLSILKQIQKSEEEKQHVEHVSTSYFVLGLHCIVHVGLSVLYYSVMS